MNKIEYLVAQDNDEDDWGDQWGDDEKAGLQWTGFIEGALGSRGARVPLS